MLAVLFAVIGLAAFSFGIARYRTADPGWTEVEADAAADVNLSENFTLYWHLGEGNMTPTAEKKLLTTVYSEEMTTLWQQFSATQYVEHVNNLYEINRQPNATVQVEPELFSALKTAVELGGRSLYYGPYYEYYNALFLAEDDYSASFFDPAKEPEIAAYFGELAAFITNPEHISLEFPAENEVRLQVSEEYLAYIKQEEIEVLIDLSPAMDAFAADYTAAKFKEQNLINGCLTSYDGMIASLVPNEELNFQEYELQGTKIAVKQEMAYTGARNIVSLRNFPIQEKDANRFYLYQDGTIVGGYINDQGLQAARFPTLSAWSEEKSCVEIYYALLPWFTGSTEGSGAAKPAKESADGSLPALEDIREALKKEGIHLITE